MPRLERHGTTDRFWEIVLVEDGFRMRFGPCVGEAVERHKRVSSAARAASRYARAIEVMLEQGYERVLPEPGAEPPVDEHPESHQVLADHLLGRGDPRGELMVLQLALREAGPERTHRLRTRVAQVLDAHRSELLGPLAWLPGVTVTWKLGFLRSVGLTPGGDHDCRDVLPQLFALDASRRLRSLMVGPLGAPQHVVSQLVRGGPLPSLHSLDLRLDQLGSLEGLDGFAPVLETLLLDSDKLDLDDARLPALRRLTVRGSCVDGPMIAALASGLWPSLQVMRLDLGALEPVEEWTALQRLLGTGHLSELSVLGLRRAHTVDRLLEQVPTAPFFSRLTTLDLRGGTLTERGARFLLEHAEVFGHLDRIALSLRSVPVRLRQALLGLPTVRLAAEPPHG